MTTDKTTETPDPGTVKAPQSDAHPDQVSADPDAPDAPESDLDAPDADDGSKASREAKKYRLRAKEAEQQVEALTGQVDALRRELAEHYAGTTGRLSAPDALWAAGHDVNDLLDDEGNVDRDKVIEAADATARKFHMTRRPKPVDFGPPKEDFLGPSMADVIGGRK